MQALSSLDLLSLSAEEQSIVRCLMLESPLSEDALAQQLTLDHGQLEQVLLRMTSQQYIVRQELNGLVVFSVQMRRNAQRIRNSALLNFNEGPA